jgi:hypothetical protein
VSNLSLFLFIGALILGVLGYTLERISHFKLSRKILVILLVFFILFSIGQFIFSNFDFLTLEKKFEAEKTTIRDFEAKILVKFSGDWPIGIGRRPLFSDNNYLKLIVKNSKNKNIEIKFFTIKPFILRDIDKNHGYFESVQAVHKGDYPLGQNKKELSKINIIEFVIPFLDNAFNTNKLILGYKEFKFIINGEKYCTINNSRPFEADIKSKNAHSWVNIKQELINTNLYEYCQNQTP